MYMCALVRLEEEKQEAQSDARNSTVVVVPMTVSMSMLPVPRRRRRLPAHRPSRRVLFVPCLSVVVVSFSSFFLLRSMSTRVSTAKSAKVSV